MYLFAALPFLLAWLAVDLCLQVLPEDCQIANQAVGLLPKLCQRLPCCPVLSLIPPISSFSDRCPKPSVPPQTSPVWC